MTTGLPGTLNITAYRGDTKAWTVAFADDSTPPTAVDVSAWTWLAQVRSTLDEPNSVVATFDVDTTDAATGTLVVTLPATEAANLITVDGRATYYWDLQGTNGTVVKTWLAGKVKVTGDVSVTA